MLEYDVKRRSGHDQLLSKFQLLSLLATTVNQKGAHPAKVVIPSVLSEWSRSISFTNASTDHDAEANATHHGSGTPPNPSEIPENDKLFPSPCDDMPSS